MDDKYTGETVKSKYERIAEKLEGADLLVVATLDDIAWFTNMRGNDIEYNPLFFSYMIFHNKKEGSDYKVDLFISKNKVSTPEVSQFLSDNNVTIHEYNQLGDKLTEYSASLASKKVVLDETSMNYKVYNLLKTQNFEIIHKDNVVELMKASKNKP